MAAVLAASVGLHGELMKRKRKFVEAPSGNRTAAFEGFTFAGEPVGWIIDNIGPDMLVFASDYPHPEGTSNPIAKFERTMENCDQLTMDKSSRQHAGRGGRGLKLRGALGCGNGSRLQPQHSRNDVALDFVRATVN